ncbi:adenylate kinase 2 [Talaromyces proteolyticus]|uniref:GTP:AMP phosphotransferase, mitochondrial n=1 Tax=Talaromyces proteolyticus TaxID=1131652 RepID=A0AAD4KVA4_9EURO|nr:adenylate kinase 2 [Talaromyces proteolyticus]KAH8700630.1 adenylate kinase 2 [Talaromyces proteolyticus]
MTSTTKRLKKAARIILIGAPGVGKGTQTERLLARFPQLAAISSGDLLRDNVRRKTPLGIQAETLMQAGNLVPDAVMLDLISTELSTKGWITPSQPGEAASPSTKPSTAVSFILDGFPRTATQATSLDQILPINFAVHLLTPPAVIISRITKRWIHAPSGRVYNTDFNPPKVFGKDDITGEPLTQREDDSIQTWKERLNKFEESSRTLLDHYNNKGCLWRVEGNSSDEISPKIYAEIERRFS